MMRYNQRQWGCIEDLFGSPLLSNRYSWKMFFMLFMYVFLEIFPPREESAFLKHFLSRL